MILLRSESSSSAFCSQNWFCVAFLTGGEEVITSWLTFDEGEEEEEEEEFSFAFLLLLVFWFELSAEEAKKGLTEFFDIQIDI